MALGRAFSLNPECSTKTSNLRITRKKISHKKDGDHDDGVEYRHTPRFYTHF